MMQVAGRAPQHEQQQNNLGQAKIRAKLMNALAQFISREFSIVENMKSEDFHSSLDSLLRFRSVKADILC